MIENTDKTNEEKKSLSFVEQIVEGDLSKGKNGSKIQTRFPPEPNGYLHIGHAKSLCLNFGTAKKYNGVCNLFFDDTNPSKEKTEYVNAIKEDIKWLGFEWFEIHYASDFFEDIYALAVKLIKDGKAYVCDLSAEEIKNTRGTLTEPGIESPYRNRSIEENLKLFEEMKKAGYDYVVTGHYARVDKDPKTGLFLLKNKLSINIIKIFKFNKHIFNFV